MTPDMDHGTCDFYKNMFINVIFQVRVFDVQTQNSYAEVFQVQVLYCELWGILNLHNWSSETSTSLGLDFSLFIRLNVTRLAGLLWQKAWLILTLYFPGCTANHRLVERMSSVWGQSDLGRSTDNYERSTVDSRLMLHELVTALNICCWYLVLPGRSEKIATYTKLRNLFWLTWLS